ncbi:lipopolysaccharide biosynthesis protein [Vibrio sp. 10N.286.51.B11]|uniref:lipopolysaccharide biosynthesis protein n=1 Tax=Vibrio sp. 10N.286.51.B11 TaxID=3229706 RepID=UPI00354D18E2
MKDLKSKGIKAFVWDFLGKLATQGTGFIVTIFLARLLEPSDFGLIAMLMVVVGVAQVFTDVGLGGALIQRRKLLEVHYSSVFYFNISIALALTCITYYSADFIARFYNNIELVKLTQVISVIFIINACSSVQAIRLRKQLNYPLLTKASFQSSLLSGVLGVTLAFNGWGVWSLVAQILSQGIFYNIILWKTANWRPTLTFSLKALRQLWGFGFRMFLSSLLDAIFTRLDFLIIGKLFPVTTLGYFQRAKQFNALIIQYSSGSLMSVMFPILSKVQNDLPRFRGIIIDTLNILCFVVFLLLGGVYLTAEELILFLFSDKWLPSVQYMELLLLSGFAYPLSALLVNVLISRGNSRAFLKLEIMKKSLHTLNFLNAYYNGIEVYLYGLVLVSLFSVMLNIIFASKELNMDSMSFLNPILSQMILGICSVVLSYQVYFYLDLNIILGFLMKVMLFFFLYVGFNFIFKTSPSNSIHQLLVPILRQKVGVK